MASATELENWKGENGKKVSLAEAVAAADCGKIYLMLGVNELGWKGTDIFRGHAENLIRRLKADHPDAELVIQSLLPVSAEQGTKGSYVNNQRILAYNQVWRELAEENGCAYVDVAEPPRRGRLSAGGVELRWRSSEPAAAGFGWTISGRTA